MNFLPIQKMSADKLVFAMCAKYAKPNGLGFSIEKHEVGLDVEANMSKAVSQLMQEKFEMLDRPVDMKWNPPHHNKWQKIIRIIRGTGDDIHPLNHAIHRAGNKIAKRTRRGIGNVLIYNPGWTHYGMESSLTGTPVTKIRHPLCPLDKMLLLYMGENDFDAGYMYVEGSGLFKQPDRFCKAEDYGMWIQLDNG